MKNLIFNMSGDFVPPWDDAGTFDFSALEGTGCYCDPESAAFIRKSIRERGGVGRINWIDTGDYHYLSLFTTELVGRDYALVVIDRHPDTQKPRFEGILSCGSWVREALDSQTNLKLLLLCGINPELVPELEDLGNHNIQYICSTLPERFETDLPVYLSIDLDALTPEYARTNWDQGNISLDELTGFISSLSRDHEIIGVDICGGLSLSKGRCDSDEAVNISTRNILKQLLTDIL